MPVLDLTDEELQGFVHLCATASGPGVSWMLTNALLTKARLAQEASKTTAGTQAALASQYPLGRVEDELPRNANSQDKGHAAVPRA